MKKFLAILTLPLALMACNTDQSTTAQADTKPAPQAAAQAPTQAATQAVAPKAAGVWIDVRSADEYNAGHLDGAVNIAHTDIASQIAKVAPNKSEPVNLYCKSGRRAEMARQELIKLGYTNVTNHGGYEELLKQGIK